MTPSLTGGEVGAAHDVNLNPLDNKCARPTTEAGIADINLQGRLPLYLVPRTVLQDKSFEKIPYDPMFNRFAYLEIDLGGI